MPSSKPDDEYNAEEAERRATAALRRALTTPYKPQRELVGKKKRVPGGERPKSAPKGPEGGGA